MHTTTRAPRTRSLWSKWPATTISALAGLTALVLVMATGSGSSELSADQEERTDEEASDERFEGFTASETKAETKSGMPARSRSRLYAMKGPTETTTEEAFVASPHGGAFAAGGDDADVWGSLTGTEVGEAYGVGGLGLVGTGRGGGGTGSGYGRGIGSDGGRRPSEPGSYGAHQSRVLTVGTVDDNADPKGYQKALDRLADARASLEISDAMWKMTPPKQRHAEHPGGLDVALVIDTTGSMGDELEYLKVELRDIAREVSHRHPGVTQRWGLVVYRDGGDEYVTRSIDFRGIDSFIEKLGEQRADGGGDYPEAMDRAMDASAELSWRRGPGTARMVFLVADAPTRSGDDTKRYASAVLEHRAAGTAIFPVGASGVSDEAEAELRLAAKVTGGQYIFLTDHSGVGDAHAAPKVDQFKVETLHAAMTRVIGGELGDVGSKARVPALETSDETPLPMPLIMVETDTSELVQCAPGVWEELRERLAAHFLFALGALVMMLAGIGLDTLIHRLRGR